MRNKYKGKCELCSKEVPPKMGRWRLIPNIFIRFILKTMNKEDAELIREGKECKYPHCKATMGKGAPEYCPDHNHLNALNCCETCKSDFDCVSDRNTGGCVNSRCICHVGIGTGEMQSPMQPKNPIQIKMQHKDTPTSEEWEKEIIETFNSICVEWGRAHEGQNDSFPTHPHEIIDWKISTLIATQRKEIEKKINKIENPYNIDSQATFYIGAKQMKLNILKEVNDKLK